MPQDLKKEFKEAGRKFGNMGMKSNVVAISKGIAKVGEEASKRVPAPVKKVARRAGRRIRKVYRRARRAVRRATR